MGEDEKENNKEENTKKASDLPPPGNDFLLFIQSIAAQAGIALGVVPPVGEKEASRDLKLAKYFIDVLGMLEKKTNGNRTPEEDKYLKEVLTQLRLTYIEVQKNDKQA